MKCNYIVINDYCCYCISILNGMVNIVDCMEYIVGGDIVFYGINFMS